MELDEQSYKLKLLKELEIKKELEKRKRIERNRDNFKSFAKDQLKIITKDASKGYVEFEFNVEYNSMCRFLDYPEDTYTVRLPNHGSLENLSSEYFTEKTEGEKFSMTNFVEHINEKDDYELNFYNTAGGQRTPFTLLDEFGNDVSFKIPSLYKIPDCIFTHNGVMKMVEGKDERHYKHGIKELKDWDNLEKLIREKALWGGDIERYLVTDKLVLNKTHRQYAGYFLTKDDYSLNIL